MGTHFIGGEKYAEKTIDLLQVTGQLYCMTVMKLVYDWLKTY